MNRAFTKIFLCSMAVAALCAGVAYCASVKKVDFAKPCAAEKNAVQDSHEFSALGNDGLFSVAAESETDVVPLCTQSEKINPSLFSLPRERENLNDCVWLTTNLHRDRRRAHASGNAAEEIAYKATLEKYNGISITPTGVLMIVISIMGIAGYIFERITTARRNSLYR